MMSLQIIILAVSLTLASGQRPSFAGSRPIGYPEIIKPTTDGLVDRFGEDDVPTTTIRLPIEANGDRDLVDRLSKLPIDQQPFWFINWQAYEAHRQNPQTFPQKPNDFADSGSFNQQSSGFNQAPMSQPSNQANNFNRPMPSQSQMNFNQGQMNFNRPQPSFNQGQSSFHQGQSSFNQGSSNESSDGLSNRFSDSTNSVKPESSNTVQTTARPVSLEELYKSQRIRPVTNADGTTSWQIVDKSVVEALEKLHNKN